MGKERVGEETKGRPPYLIPGSVEEVARREERWVPGVDVAGREGTMDQLKAVLMSKVPELMDGRSSVGSWLEDQSTISWYPDGSRGSEIFSLHADGGELVVEEHASGLWVDWHITDFLDEEEVVVGWNQNRDEASVYVEFASAPEVDFYFIGDGVKIGSKVGGEWGDERRFDSSGIADVEGVSQIGGKRVSRLGGMRDKLAVLELEGESGEQQLVLPLI